MKKNDAFSDALLKGLRKAVANAVAWHTREGRDVTKVQMKPLLPKKKNGK